MRDAFARLKDNLDAVEHWLEEFLKQPMTREQRKLANSLAKYLQFCRRDDRKLRSESAAERAIVKMNKAWWALYLAQRRRP